MSKNIICFESSIDIKDIYELIMIFKHQTAIHGHLEVMKVLILRGADIKIKNKYLFI